MIQWSCVQEALCPRLPPCVDFQSAQLHAVIAVNIQLNVNNASNLLYHVFPVFVYMYCYIFHTIGEWEGKLVLLLMCNTLLWCKKSTHEVYQYNLKDMDYESKRKLCDLPTSRLCSGCVFLSQHLVNALTIATITVGLNKILFIHHNHK